MRKPNIFVAYDILLGFGTCLTTGLTIYLLFCGITQFQVFGLMSLISLIFIAFWGASLYSRYRFLQTFTWYPELNMMIQFNGYRGLPNPIEYTNYILDRWEAYHPAKSIFKQDVVWVFFQKELNEHVFVWRNRIIKGLVVADTRTAYVDFDAVSDKIEDTAFAHELGHIIRGHATNQWSNEEHHKFFSEHGLGRIVLE